MRILLSSLAIAAAILSAGPIQAAEDAHEDQATPARPKAGSTSEEVPGVDENKPLSEQLEEDEGVIDPPSVGDSEIDVPAPDPDPGTTVVIPPPGSPGGDPTVQPK
ncbi:hypothetical protein A7A08_02576 [Methyloligella halotolerans]|uniref:Secreted protein n=1 Tax=Methyloligella halotolerans TaxID=1177755 RepID=A0A1E2RW64_9HYPH|nr:hypothetical protein [Methyloligella halotolerans]ODA66453.1 hypothetical protein A7A08_02576 [Methyloligella halotolerans]